MGSDGRRSMSNKEKQSSLISGNVSELGLDFPCGPKNLFLPISIKASTSSFENQVDP